MNVKEYVLTAEGKQKLEAELEHLKNVTRKEVSEQIKEARSYGDLSENAEYDAAKDKQAEVEARISEIEQMLKYAKIIEATDIKTDIVTPGAKIVLEMFGEQATYTLVGTSEADPNKNMISYESPVGAAVLNHSAGEVVQAAAPAGSIEIKIIKIGD